ncbi:hypothetical protein BSKO_02345 [Bryopsis sp. KO-2023]|nr:hypothetical protein BSKO_02345 [Bryopsis sp. KO-2023]
MVHSWPPYAVGACLLFSFCDSFRQFYKPKPEAKESYLTRIATSQTVSRGFLLGCRVLVSIGSVAILWGHAIRFGLTDLKYFTIWSYCLLTLYFVLASIITHWYSAHPKDCQKNKQLESLCKFIAAIFHITATVVWIVDAVTWTVIWPMIKHSNRDKPEELAHATMRLFNIYSYVEHGVNIPIILVELSINNIRFERHMLGYVGLWSLYFGLFAIAFFYMTGRWIYTVIDFTKTWSPLFYLGVHFAHYGCFFWSGFLKTQIDYLLIGRKTQANEGKHAKFS